MLDIIKKWEGCILTAYQDIVGVWTIGYGNTFYEDGTKVKSGDIITNERAEELLAYTVESFKKKMNVTATLNDNQWSAILSLAYNIGYPAFNNSTLLRKLNKNPNNPSIRDEFAKWCKAGGKKIKGLVNRRKEEADLYFKSTID